jgi:prepilin-type N-terminal cleavage/methylation domain-containing protein
MNHSNRQHRQSDSVKATAAFTFVELLVVIAIVGLLAVTIGTALATTRSNNATFQCINNLRQLGQAFRMYSDDNQDALVFNAETPNAGKSPFYPAWVAGWLDEQSTTTDNTNSEFLINHKKYPYGAYFGPYLKTASVFKCPADPTLVKIAGAQMPMVRSVSLSNLMGNHSRSWTSNSGFLLYSKANQMGHPGQLFTFLDERPDGINDGVFFSDPDTQYQIVDYPGYFHAGAGSFGFGDGHAESHRWVDSRTVPILTSGQLLPLNVNLPGNVDTVWLRQHVSEHK